jgi:hypothetical protein
MARIEVATAVSSDVAPKRAPPSISRAETRARSVTLSMSMRC